MNTRLLDEIGLTENESKIYLSLLRLGSATAGEITEKSGVHRRNVYDAIDRLAEKGLVSAITKNNKKYFQPSDPKELLTILKNKEKTIETIIPDLKNLYENPETRQEIRIFYGEPGLKALMDIQAEDNKEIFVLASKNSIAEILRFTFPEYVKKRVEKGIWINFIFNSFEAGKKVSEAPLSRVRYFPKEHSVPSTFMIWGGKSAVMVFTENSPIIVLFDNPDIAKDYMDYFTLIWQIAIR
ncbi:MAG: helix-turn-helix domain-containing protein [archaeon]